MAWFWKKSTRAFVREGRRTNGFSLKDLLHGYVYARWPYFYIRTALGRSRPARVISGLAAPLLKRRSSPKGDSALARDFAAGYHGKVLTTSSAVRLVKVGRNIAAHDLERILPYPRARDIVMQNPKYIVALECPCRSARDTPCHPLDVCLIIGEPFAPFILEHHPSRARRITSEEAADILKKEHERGHVHHAFFKDAMLGRFYAICNCCSCCCGAMQAFRNGVPMLADSGYVCEWEAAECSGCGQCESACPFDALSWKENFVVIQPEKCMGCGVCTTSCTSQALRLVRDETRPDPLEVRSLTESGQSE